MAVVYTKQDQGITFYMCDSAPTHSANLSDQAIDNSTGKNYYYDGVSWKLLGANTYIRRHQTTEAYDYLGYAENGTLESDPTWTLTRLTLDSSGVSATMTATDSWDNRVTATYI